MEVRLGSCLDPVSGLASLPDKSVDVVITDPPYEAEVHAEGRRIRDPGGAKGAAKYRKCVEAPLPFAAITQQEREDVADRIADVVRRWVLVFCQVEASQAWAGALRSAGLDYVRTMVWVKPDGQPQFTGDRPGMGYESIVVAHPKGRKRWNGGGRVGVFVHNKNAGHGEPHPHPTTKPLPLISELVSLFSDPGELVVDPYAGSGTTGVACRALGRRFVGWEISPEYHAIATRRLAGERAVLNDAQPELFGAGS
jgi:DNA modification methylase